MSKIFEYKKTENTLEYQQIPLTYNIEKIDLEELKNAVYYFRRIIDMQNEESFKKNFISWSKLIRTKEALKNATIEGSPITLEELLIKEPEIENDQIKFKKRDNELEFNRITEILNLRRTVILATEELKKVPLSTNFYKKLHNWLFNNITSLNIYSSKKEPGHFKTTTNYIGNNETKEIVFIPCEVNNLQMELSKLDELINDFSVTENVDYEKMILYSGLVHALFERIHPFSDGNGRLGRLLVPLYFYNIKATNDIIIFISEEISKKENITEYYKELSLIDKLKNYDSFLNWYLKIFTKSIKNIIEYNNAYKTSFDVLFNAIVNTQKSFFVKNALALTEVLLVNAIITPKSFVSNFNKISKNTKINTSIFYKTLSKNLITYKFINEYENENLIINKKNYYYKSNFFLKLNNK